MKKPWEIYGLPAPKSEASKGELSLVDYEIYSGIEVPEELPLFVRLDGWNFHSLTKKLNLEKPYDTFFANSLLAVARELFKAFNCSLGYVFSDELNILFLKIPAWRRIEKINSVFAGIASARFYKLMSERFPELPIFSFDCRCIPLPKEKIIEYLVWRQAECFRNFNNAWAQQVLIKKGFSSARATKELAGMKAQELRKIIFENIAKEKLESWQERGILLYRESHIKKGYNPITKEYVEVKRYGVKENRHLPWFESEEGRAFIEKIIRSEGLKRQSQKNLNFHKC
ncbi:MAG: tRNA(His) guanylyltransferase Thg1 family protein [Candidatus Thermoplasmatota archaeon]|nr:tRNA(His) guanylyltransferase Thg1 family protein [Candidatus Thermoplasmatota archaeon]